MLFSGTVLSQAVLFLMSPVLSRLYSAEDFGNFSNYNAWVMVLAILSNLRYEHAIIISKNKEESYKVLNLTVILSFLGFLVFALLSVLSPWLTFIGYIQQIKQIIPFLAIGTLFVCINSVFIQLHIKYARFRIYTIVNFVQVLLIIGTQVSFGFLDVENGLIFGTIIATAVSGAVLFYFFFKRESYRHLKKLISWEVLRSTAKEYIDLPKFSMPTDVVNGVVQQFAPVIILAYFDPTIAGLYFFSVRVIKTPIIVFNSSFSAVLRQKAAELYINRRPLNHLYRRTLLNSIAISAIPFAVLFFYGGPIFTFVFGDQWTESGEILRILTPGFFVEFSALPLASLFLVTNNQKINLMIQATGFVALFAVIYLGSQFGGDFIRTCYYISALTIFVNLVSLVYSYRVAVVWPQKSGKV